MNRSNQTRSRSRANDRCSFAPFQRRQTGYESPLFKEGGATRIAVTDDCFKFDLQRQDPDCFVRINTLGRVLYIVNIQKNCRNYFDKTECCFVFFYKN